MPSKPQNIDILWGCCKLYHKTTWFETILEIINNSSHMMLQIISQNYVVWNVIWFKLFFASFRLQIISQNYVVWNARACYFLKWWKHVANYITKLRGLKRVLGVKINRCIAVANYITKLRGLKLLRKSQSIIIL